MNIAIIHSQQLYQRGLSMLLNQAVEHFTVVACTDNLRDLIHGYRQEIIDVIVWDIPGHHVLTPGTRLLKECFPLAKILVLVASTNTVYAGLLETLGADKVMAADCDLEALVESIKTIHKKYAPPPSSNHVQEPPLSTIKPLLSQHELAVLKLLAEGQSSTLIAKKFATNRAQVAKTLHAIKGKLGVSTNSMVIQKALNLQLISPNKYQHKS